MTRTEQATTHYGVTVPAIDDARRAQNQLDKLLAQADDVRARRNTALWDAHNSDGLTLRTIRDQMGSRLSLSALREILKVERAARRSR